MKKNSMTLQGIVTPIEMDEDDSVVAVALSTDEGEYIIANNPKGRELLDYIDEEMEITGKLTIDEDGNNVIAVTSFSFLDEDDDEWYEEEDLDDFDEEEDEDLEEEDFDEEEDKKGKKKKKSR
jgi:hypothetical protein